MIWNYDRSIHESIAPTSANYKRFERYEAATLYGWVTNENGMTDATVRKDVRGSHYVGIRLSRNFAAILLRWDITVFERSFHATKKRPSIKTKKPNLLGKIVLRWRRIHVTRLCVQMSAHTLRDLGTRTHDCGCVQYFHTHIIGTNCTKCPRNEDYTENSMFPTAARWGSLGKQNHTKTAFRQDVSDAPSEYNTA
jgi:hypothetical protein